MPHLPDDGDETWNKNQNYKRFRLCTELHKHISDDSGVFRLNSAGAGWPLVSTHRSGALSCTWKRPILHKKRLKGD